MPPWEHQGTHRFYREEDLLYFELHGLFTLADAQRLYVELESLERAHGYALTAYDARAVTGMDADSRRYLGEKTRGRAERRALAVIGASFALRTILGLVQNGARLAGRPVPKTAFCSTQSEALAWLAAQRVEFRADTRSG